MAENSNIQWTDHTFNPWIGCTKVSPGCLNCYAETLDTMRFAKTLGEGTKEAPVSHWGKGAPRHRTSDDNWKKPLKWDRQAATAQKIYENSIAAGGVGDAPQRPRVFCASLADWLDDEVPIEWMVDLLELIRATPNLDWLLLTKRPQNFFRRIREAAPGPSPEYLGWRMSWLNGTPPPNVWIGTTAEDQTRANERIPKLLKIPAAIRFLSCEPLLGALDLTRAGGIEWDSVGSATPGEGESFSRGLVDWVITGGESGTDCRPADLEWFRSLRCQCQAAAIPFFMKQLGGVRDHRGNLEDMPEDLRIRQFPTSH